MIDRKPDTTMTAYEHSAAYASGHLAVSELHSIYYEQYGKPDGKPGPLRSIHATFRVPSILTMLYN